MGYLTNQMEKENATLKIPADYKQVFQNPFKMNVGKIQIVKMMASGVLNDRDVEIAKFLFRFRFATASQIERELNLGLGDEGFRRTKAMLRRLVEHRIVNRFVLKDVEDGDLPKDALSFYCLDLGGRYLLDNYSNEDLTNWFTISNMMSAELISVFLVTTELYLRLKESIGDRLLHFTSNPELRINDTSVYPHFEFSLEYGSLTRYFIGQVARSYDFPVNFREKLHIIEQILTTNAWKKYYYEDNQEPVLIVIGDTPETVVEAGKFIANATEIKRVRYSTDDFIQTELSKGAFMRYVPESNKLQRVAAKVFQ